MSEEKLVKVRATRMGYYNHRRVQPGEVLEIPEKDVSLPRKIKVKDRKTGDVIVQNYSGWHELVKEGTPVTVHEKKNDPYKRTPLSHELEIV